MVPEPAERPSPAASVAECLSQSREYGLLVASMASSGGGLFGGTSTSASVSSGEVASSGGGRVRSRSPRGAVLTWYETLLVARVHQVISVVTLLLTGQLCYSGHVCNYFVKTFQWFQELPNLLRDKNLARCARL